MHITGDLTWTVGLGKDCKKRWHWNSVISASHLYSGSNVSCKVLNYLPPHMPSTPTYFGNNLNEELMCLRVDQLPKQTKWWSFTIEVDFLFMQQSKIGAPGLVLSWIALLYAVIETRVLAYWASALILGRRQGKRVECNLQEVSCWPHLFGRIQSCAPYNLREEWKYQAVCPGGRVWVTTW